MKTGVYATVDGWAAFDKATGRPWRISDAEAKRLLEAARAAKEPKR